MKTRCLLALLGALLAGPAVADDLPSPPLLADMVAPAEILSMVLSPDGKQVAGIGYSGRTTGLFLVDAQTLAARRVELPSPSSGRLYWRRPIRVSWAAADVMVVDYDSEESESIDLSGKKLARLGERFIRRMTEKGRTGDFVLAYRDLHDGDIDRVNVRTGERRAYRVALSGRPVQWAFDAAGELRAVTMRDTGFWSAKTKVSNWYRTDEKSPWQLLQEAPVTEEFWLPVRALPEQNMLAVLSRHGRDTEALFRYDVTTRQHVGLMAGHPTQDLISASGLDNETFTSVLTDGIKPERTWFDPAWSHVQVSVDGALPGRINVPSGDPKGRVLIFSYGDVDPGRWFLLDSASMSMREIGSAQPRVDPRRMRPMETISYAARDGLTVNAYLTRPPGPADRPAPMVVLIHGGPNVRDRWEWNEEVQLLASYGYVVFQPQFRGSSGFGHRFEEAGYRQWGLAMQDDITDGVNELIARKIADPGRVCIYGASYGGYAALWGVIKTPALYRCGVSFAGVSDLEMWVTGSLFDDSNSIAREIKRARIGDASQQREQFAQVSPLKNAARVQVPLLIAHGEQDTRVLISQSEKMVAALKAQGKAVEWMTFPNEGHGLAWIDNRKSYYAALVSFLQRHIGPVNEPAPTSAASAPP